MPDAAYPSVLTDSLSPTAAPASLHNHNYMVGSSHKDVSSWPSLSAVKAVVTPTRPWARLAHRCVDHHLQECCFTQKWSGSPQQGASAAAEGSPKPHKGMPARQGSTCPALAPQWLGGFPAVLFLTFCGSTYHCTADPSEPKLHLVKLNRLLWIQPPLGHCANVYFGKCLALPVGWTTRAL